MSIYKPMLSFAPLILLTACAADEAMFPSLERRPYESKNPIAAPEAPPPAPVSLPATLATRVDSLNVRHRAAEAAFAKDLPSVRSVASKAAGNAPGSEAWVNAHLQLSRLDKARADSVAVVREFDSLISEQADGDTDFVPLLADAQKPIADAVAKQNEEIERLSRLIGE